MALQVTPYSAASRAVTRVSPRRPCLAATYADLKAEARSACTDAILITRPHLWAYMPGSTALVSRNGAVSISSMICRHFASGNSVMGATYWMPALFTRMSTWPSALVVSATSPEYHLRSPGLLPGNALPAVHLQLRALFRCRCRILLPVHLAAQNRGQSPGQYQRLRLSRARPCLLTLS